MAVIIKQNSKMCANRSRIPKVIENFLIISSISFCVPVVLSNSTENQNSNQKSVDQFLRLLTGVFNESSFHWMLPFGQQKDLNDDYQNVINNYLAQLPNNQIDFASSTTRKPNSGQQNDFQSPQKPQGGRPGPVAQYPYPVPPGPGLGSYPPYPSPVGPYPPYPHPVPAGYRPPFNYRPQSSFVAALESISRYDDLRCVPRLLCEVTSGGRKIENSSPIPFISKDAVVTLLTVLNFVDDSPLLMFARAAFLGYSSGGDTRACLVAYPTCPRDPNMLIDYLNNHNGGFFRFFNQQLNSQPQYEQVLAVNKLRKDKRQSQFAQVIKPKNEGISSRILNDPIDIDYVRTENYYNTPSGPHWKQLRKIKFQSQENSNHQDQEGSFDENNFYNKKTFGYRGGRKLSFPKRVQEPQKSIMTFPDKTGTGNLILSSDVDGHYKVLFVNDNEQYIQRKMKKIKFLNEDDQRTEKSRRFSTKMKFPVDEE